MKLFDLQSPYKGICDNYVKYSMHKVKILTAIKLHSLMRVSAVHLYTLQNPMIPQDESKGPDQAAQKHRLTWVFSVSIYAQVTLSYNTLVMHSPKVRHFFQTKIVDIFLFLHVGSH